ncbi:MAG: peptide chain release factor 1 [Candidatus Sungbacteria bacterium]|uniref:Peptide chain release factor 1 n=1 Tax=Candidatus Sungiibacteriota bacterium TaxID=2750080 RepID=A0A931SBX6_9BACT|nr:peptide chain release factor 1 [Candidatus Sungbacteria bacterium]
MDRSTVKKEIGELAKKLSDPEFLSNSSEAKRAGARLQKLQQLQRKFEALDKVRTELREAENLAKETNGDAMADLAREEISELTKNEAAIQKEISGLLHEESTMELPHDVIMEIRAGAGGEEAALFAAKLFQMYRKFAESKRWEVNPLSSSPSELGGIKEIIFEVNGRDVFRSLRHESGVHRVQRIPETEKQGRIHTSTASIAVLPQVKDIDVEIKPQDIKVEFFRSSGPGGQNVNKVETAVRITHVPTGYVVTSQEGRSQLKNRERAMSLLRARIYDIQRQAEEQKLAAERKSQIGTGDRSEKIRTYNFPQDRVTDHRINKSWHNIEGIMQGKIDEIVTAFQNSPSRI